MIKVIEVFNILHSFEITYGINMKILLKIYFKYLKVLTI